MFELSGFIGLIIFILDVWAILRILKSKAEDLNKAIWIGVIVFLPIFGLLLWLLFGPSPED